MIKQNTLSYEAFHKSLPNMTKSGTSGRSLKLIHYNPAFEKKITNNENLKYFKSIIQFADKIFSFDEPQPIIEEFKVLLKNNCNFKEVDVLLFNSSSKSLKGFHNIISKLSKNIFTKPATFEILSETFASKNIRTLIDRAIIENQLEKIFCFLIPALSQSKEKILISLSTLSPDIKENSIEILFAQAALQQMLGRLDTISKGKEIISTYKELQLYQSKLSNDYKLSAVGELTTGIVDEILSPLQVIISYTEFFKKEISGDEDIAETIERQVEKVKEVVNRLIEFTNIDDVKSKLQSCDLNKLTKEFYNMVISSLNNYSYECILDLDENIPTLLINANDMNQIFTNLFSFLFNKGNNLVGLIIQTRYQSENIILRFLSTENINDLEENEQKSQKFLNLKIVKNLVDKYQGEINLESNIDTGTILQISFPLKRNIGE